MKELSTRDNKFTESEVKKENKFSRSRNFDFTCIHFNIYECLKWLEKPLWLINTKFGDITDMLNKYRKKQQSQGAKFGDVTDMFIKYRSRSPKVVCKNGVFDSFAKFTIKHLCRSLLLKK